MKKIISYACGFCETEYPVELLCFLHETQCAHNPINKACETCKHLAENRESQEYCLINEDIFYGTKRNCEKWEPELISS